MKFIKPALLLFFYGHLFSAWSQTALWSEDANKFKYANDMMSQGKYQEAINYCKDILNNNKNVDVYLLQASAYRTIGDYEDAEKVYTYALNERRTDGQIFQNRGMVNFCLKNYEKAEEDFTEALRLLKEKEGENNYNFLLYEEIARVYHQKGDYKNAIVDFSNAIEKGSFTANIEILASLFREQRFEDLRNYCTTVLNNSGQNGFGITQDSSIYNYVKAMYLIAGNGNQADALKYITEATSKYKINNRSCYSGLQNDMICTKAYLCFINGQDSLAYELYKTAYADNNLQADIKTHLEELKVRLKIDITPPSIVLVNPQAGANESVSTNKATLDLYARVQDSTGISSVSVNNKVVDKIESDGMFETKIDLQPGMNNIVIRATDKFENMSEKKFTVNRMAGYVEANDTTNIPEVFMEANYHAILIGEKDYADRGFPSLESPAKDAKDLKDILTQYYQFDEKNVALLIDAGRKHILDTISAIASSLKENDNLLIFYAGHGDVKKDADNKIIAGSIIPSDAEKGSWSSYIPSGDLHSAIEICPAKHILFIVDACFGGALLRGTMDDAPENIKTQYSTKSRQMMTSGNLESVPDKGAFIAHLKAYLKDNPRKYVSVQDLFLYLYHNSEYQSPVLGSFKDLGDAGGNFIFLKR